MTPEITSQIDPPNIYRPIPVICGPIPVACDILIGGPAGAAAAHHPGLRGRRSLRPANLRLLADPTPLERLDVAEKVRSARVAHIRAEPEPKTCG